MNFASTGKYNPKCLSTYEVLWRSEIFPTYPKRNIAPTQISNQPLVKKNCLVRWFWDSLDCRMWGNLFSWIRHRICIPLRCCQELPKTFPLKSVPKLVAGQARLLFKRWNLESCHVRPKNKGGWNTEQFYIQLMFAGIYGEHDLQWDM